MFHGKRGDLLKILWHDGLGMSLYAKRLERGRFLWPAPAAGASPFRRRSWPTCWTGSTRGTRSTPTGHRSRADPGTTRAIVLAVGSAL
ncbi:IS66 family insertion sequence element accessory protein TnpB [Muricoccus nepalensis]|uniref:IS66 family insertion sequence element accessory protein TnpB n=1 Tax=Muricoccus nepalensis TaxID=1854500 RepID=UPI00240E466F|nr:IS66 family insertion sequence element accessory protein TnpB [Roseomonas nepalensis]